VTTLLGAKREGENTSGREMSILKGRLVSEEEKKLTASIPKTIRPGLSGEDGAKGGKKQEVRGQSGMPAYHR